MTMVAERVDFVIGVDTHKHRHTAAVLDHNGGVLQTLEVVAATPGYRRLLELAEELAPGRRVWALEGTGSYGAGLASFLQVRSEWAIEIDRPQRSPRRRGKSDPIDAIRAGREAL